MKRMILSAGLILLPIFGCAARHIAAPELRIPLACLTEDPILQGCEIGERPTKCDKALLKYRKGCEQVVVHP